MIRPTLEEVRRLSGSGDLIPIAMELYADIMTPVTALKIIQAGGGEAFLLESAPGGENWGRYTFLGYDPVMELSGGCGRVRVKRREGETVREGDAGRILKEILTSRRSPRLDFMPPFTGGFAGYFAYEYFGLSEGAPKASEKDDVGFDDFRLLCFDKVIAFDNLRQKISLIVNIESADAERNYIRGVTQLKDMETLLLSGKTDEDAPSGIVSEFSASFSKDAFCETVRKVKWHIREGDVFQCVPSIRFKAAYKGDLLGAYRKLRTVNPSPYMFYLRFDDMQIAGASPETLVSLSDGEAITRPLAGTCPRVPDETQNDLLVEQLLNDEKELAEHDMLVDLSRNDLGKVCRFGSVSTDEYRSVKKLSHVCHIASKVSGKITDDHDALDVLAAVLPAGTLSGAPKKRACEIIDDIEGVKRGVYGGAVGYIDFTGNMDMCIGIRMAVLKDGFVYAQAGAGIVDDSVPEKEYEECLRKAGAVIEALLGEEDEL
ncbi:MAG: anthranilate synthase component I family protein [Clostridiales Family XIII bacterium]|jgi:anthranilate synthase component 1|nr:anthranilate synthase component I family protein [Clostridiales Family XIII bacterium]